MKGLPWANKELIIDQQGPHGSEAARRQRGHLANQPGTTWNRSHHTNNFTPARGLRSQGRSLDKTAAFCRCTTSTPHDRADKEKTAEKLGLSVRERFIQRQYAYAVCIVWQLVQGDIPHGCSGQAAQLVRTQLRGSQSVEQQFRPLWRYGLRETRGHVVLKANTFTCFKPNI